MSLGKFLEKNSSVATIGAILALFIGVGLVVKMMTTSNDGGLLDDKWMYDLNSGQLVRAEATVLAPAESETGAFEYPGNLGSDGALVDAAVYTCGDPSAVREGMTMADLEAIDAKLAYVSRTPPGYREAVEANQAGERRDLVGTPDGKQWGGRVSALGMRLVTEANQTCEDGELPKLVKP